MRLHVYRNLYRANQSLLQAVRALTELAHEPGFRAKSIRELQSMIEETRAVMNRSLAERIELQEGIKSGRLDQQRRRV